ncbi:MAG TPA: DMT family transporter [Vicinamibacteria bacterium]|nr:DMT family transporter [Vicinamibacteria bacterium]
MTDGLRARNGQPLSPWLTLALAVVFVSFGAVLVRLAKAPPLAVSFYRVGLASLVLLPFAARDAGRAWPLLGRRRAALLVASGLALALHFATWIASLSFTSVASSVLLVNTAPLFAVVLSRLFLGERAPRVVLAAIPIALAGSALIAWGDWTGSVGSLRGNLLALAGAVTVAVYQVVGRGLRDALPLDAYVLGVWAVAAACLAALAAAFSVPLTGYSGGTWLAFLALALVPTVLGHGLVNRSLRAVPAPTVGLFLLGEPLLASLLAFLVFSERPGPWTLAGGALVLAAIALVVTGRERQPAAEPAA